MREGEGRGQKRGQGTVCIVLKLLLGTPLGTRIIIIIIIIITMHTVNCVTVSNGRPAVCISNIQ